MTPTLILGIVDLAMTILENYIPKIQEFMDRGEITIEQQAKVMKQYQSLKSKADKQFSGPEWEISTVGAPK